MLWNVDADAGALELALLNLAFNARDAMKDGGTLKISASQRRCWKASPRAFAANMSQLSISDTGEGMSPEVQGRVFEPFFTTKASAKAPASALARYSASPSRSAAG